MFQSFDVTTSPQFGTERVPLLRQYLSERKIDGFIVPHEDEYQNEYLPASNERLAWLTGFTGSAGAAIVLLSKAVMLVDGRYTLQVRQQTDTEMFEYADLVELGAPGWLKAHAGKGAVIGYDPALHSPDALAKLKDAAKSAGFTLKPLDPNPIDVLWKDRPAQPSAKVAPQPLEFAGESHADKRKRVGEAIAAEGADAALITSPASLAWLFNIRGGDVDYTPLPLGAALVGKDGRALLFIDPAKTDDAVRMHLGNEVALEAPETLAGALAALKGKLVLADPASSSAKHFAMIEAAGAKLKRARDPSALPRACKNAAELAGTKAAHVRDGAAMTRFLHWLMTEAQSGGETEISAARKLEAIRIETGSLKDLSFDTISAYGPNGAFPHYRVTEASNATLAPGSLYLVDSGGQYQDGTTDITRVVPIGEPSEEMRRRYTQVLQGHIALAAIRFPEGTSGAALDAFARQPLWMAGLDYDHGTGHGVGVYLGVHEGPQRIAKRGSDEPLRPGMIVSNEPGYYKNGEYGIRIENLQFVTEPAEIPGGERKMLGFECLTFAPLCRELIEAALLSEAELAWVNAYHAEVRAKIGPLVDGEVKTWLEAATAPIER